MDPPPPSFLNLPAELQPFIFDHTGHDRTEVTRMVRYFTCVSKEYQVALQSNPLLWPYFECSMLWDHTKIETIWNTTIKNAKKTPLVILIRDIGAAGANSFPTLSLNDIGKDCTLTLELGENDGMHELSAYQWNNPSPFKTLTLRSQDAGLFSEEDIHVFWNFPKTRTLIMENFYWIGRAPSAPWFTELEALKLQTDVCSCLYEFLLNVPNLTSLELTTTSQDIEAYAVSEFTEELILHKLEVFKINTSYTWLTSLEPLSFTCPSLKNFMLGSTSIPYKFLRRHPTITSLQVRGADSYTKLFNTVPRLTTFCLTSSAFIMHGNPEGFIANLNLLTNLTTLTIHDEPCTITAKIFMAFVSTRALSEDAKTVPKNDQRLKELTILTQKGAMEGTPWWQSPLIPEDLVILSHGFDDDPCGLMPKCTKYIMKWPK